MRAHAEGLDELVGALAAVRDGDLRGRVDSAEACELLDRIVAAPSGRTSRRRAALVLAVGAAALVAAGVDLLVGGSHGPVPASAATVLKRVASVARAQPTPIAQAGQFVYTKTQYTALDTYVDKRTSYGALIPWSRESWIGPTGGRMRQIPGQPRFPSERDRNAWIVAGRQPLTGPGASDWELLSPAKPLDLPTNPDSLFARLKDEAAHFGPRLYDEMFVEVGDSLRETNASSAQRAALYAVAARIPGVELVGTVTDAAGRRGVAVAKDDVVNHIRSTLVFDPDTSRLLGEEEETLPGNSFGYPAGTRIETVTYLVTAIVDSIGSRPGS